MSYLWRNHLFKKSIARRDRTDKFITLSRRFGRVALRVLGWAVVAFFVLCFLNGCANMMEEEAQKARVLDEAGQGPNGEHYPPPRYNRHR